MKTCISVINIKDIQKANKSEADLLELRTDLLDKKLELNEIVKKCRKPVIITIKKNDHKLIRQAINLQPAFIDIDYSFDKLGIKNKKKYNKLIISYHNFQKTPDFKLLNNLIKKGVNKIAVKINQVEDNLVIAKLLKKYPNKITAIGMGRLGIMTRLDERNNISYFSLNQNNKTAPGQLDISQRNLKLYGIIGRDIQYTLSPQMHNANFQKNKINAFYQIWDTPDLKNMMQIFREFNLSGASVTIPYKEEIIKYLDVIDKDAKKIGAVNTVVNKQGRLCGYNTDWLGVYLAIRKYSKIKDKKAIIFGKGGAAKAAKFGLEKHGAKVKLLNRVEIKNFNENFDILINATPVADKLLINRKLFHKNQIIFDFIYQKETRLLHVAKKKGCTVINGLPMLKYQGNKQFQLWKKYYHKK